MPDLIFRIWLPIPKLSHRRYLCQHVVCLIDMEIDFLRTHDPWDSLIYDQSMVFQWRFTKVKGDMSVIVRLSVWSIVSLYWHACFFLCFLVHAIFPTLHSTSRMSLWRFLCVWMNSGWLKSWHYHLTAYILMCAKILQQVSWYYNYLEQAPLYSCKYKH